VGLDADTDVDRDMAKIERHFFVCENRRPPQGKPSCGARGAGEILAALQQGLGAHPELWGRVAVTAAGCLGPCFDGPTMVVYPEGVWYAGVTLADVVEIVESHMVGGRPVERLLYRRDDEGGEVDGEGERGDQGPRRGRG
jgi:(2Fe-2S) ferredoxin